MKSVLLQMKKFITIAFYAIVLVVLGGMIYKSSSKKGVEINQIKNASVQNQAGNTIASRFSPPNGFIRAKAIEHSFASYLRKLPLYEASRDVFYYNGGKKRNQVHAAVINIDVGDRDLQQCADAIMRLRAEHLYAVGAYDDISFNFTNGFPARFSQWRNGYGIAVNGNRVSWVKNARNDSSYASFRKYLTMVYSYAGTLSLAAELPKRDWPNMQIGDVLVQGGSPGHAVIVVDMAKNNAGEKVYMIAQSYMPAQDIHVLINKNDPSNSPWYSATFEGKKILTPEWAFEKKDLKKW